MIPEAITQARIAAYAAGVGTHLPLLASTIAVARPGPVLEIGTGHCSAPMLAEMCQAMGREWLTVDHQSDWIENVLDLKPSWACSTDSFDAPSWNRECAVIFIDSSPPLDRLSTLKHWRSLAEFFVIHDTDNQGGDLAELLEYFDTFPHRYDYTLMRPWTTVVSDVRAYPGAR